MEKYVLIFMALIASGTITRAQTVTDIDGNVYHTVKIGTQVWTKENLKVTHYRNGDPIPNVADSAQWYSLRSGAFCRYNNDPSIAAVYGLLYNWYAVNDSRNIAPPGWHVPTYEDLDTLQVYLGYDLIAGGKLKETGTLHWMEPNTGANNESDFTALPGGQRADSIYSGTFTELTMQGYWWSSSQLDTTYPWGINISYNSEGMTNWAASTRRSGFSVRLIRDDPATFNRNDANEEIYIYPNPAQDRIIIAGLSVPSGELEIYDLLGGLVHRQSIAGSHEWADIRSLAPGMYVIKIAADGRSIQRKFVKE